MIVICDIETNGLENCSTIWVVGFKEVETGRITIFEKPQENPGPLLEFARNITGWVGHNFLQFDAPTLQRLIPNLEIDHQSVTDTLVLSRLLNYNIPGGHSLKAWGERLGVKKLEFSAFDTFSPEMIEYLKGDLEVSYRLYNHFRKYISSTKWKDAIQVEHQMAHVSHLLHKTGFHFNYDLAVSLHSELSEKLDTLTNELQSAFPPRSRLIREVNPKATKFGTINRTDFRWLDNPDLSPFSVNCPFSLIDFEPFNPASPKQIVERLNEAGWKPYEKTKGHLKAEKEAQGRYDHQTRTYIQPPEDIDEKLARYRVYGWKCSEANLATLPATAPEASRKLVQWLVLNSRKGDLEEWFHAYKPSTGRIHGTFNHIGAWTHRMSHSAPNMANIPRSMEEPKGREASPVEKLNIQYNGRMRALWSCPPDKYLIGVDAEGIQLRILAHYMNDKEFTFAVTQGKKEDGTDPHSLNKRALGHVCKDRNTAKTFIYAWLLGAGKGKIANILDCSFSEADQANHNFLYSYPGLVDLKQYRIPSDARRGYFEGLDGRLVLQDSEHLILAGYLQNGESIVMKRACILWRNQLEKEKIPFEQVNFVHDEWQTYVPRDLDLAKHVAQIQADAIRQVGEELNLNCPLAGSFIGDHGLTIGDNWLETH